MKTKHTFAFTFVMGLVWVGILFANSSGPIPGANGVVGPNCNQIGCHVGNNVNQAGGSVTVGGLPATWTAGASYELTVTVNRAGSSRYGFQFSAVNDATNAQSGTLLPSATNDARVQIISGFVPGALGNLQFAEHTSTFFSPGTPFRFRWTAPATGSGPIRFNVAGNAANGDATSNGDFIYVGSSTVSEAGPTDTAPPVISAVTASAITTSSATITWTTDEASDTEVEFGLTAAYGQSTTLNATLATAHTATLTGLASNTTYHYRVKSKDAGSNLAIGTDNTLRTPFAISNLGGVSRTTDGSGNLTVGYGRIRATAGTTPSGVGIFGLRQSGVLVTEAGVPDQPLITSGRIYAEVSGESSPIVNTGLAFANPSATAGTITYVLRDTSGNTIKSGSTPIGANSELVGFLNEPPYSSGNGIQGTFSFTSTVPVGVIALRGFYNERTPSEFLLTTLPVLDLAATVSSGTQVIPHFAAGGGWTTQIVLLNPTSTAQTGTIQFLSQGSSNPPAGGAPTTVEVDGAAVSSASYSVAADSSKKFRITAPGLVVGSVRIVPAAGGAVPTPLVIFTYKPGAITASEAGIPVTMGTTFRMFAELSSSPPIKTGIAVANATSVAGTVTLALTDLNGAPIAQVSKPLPAQGQFAGFINDPDLMAGLAGQTIQGVLRISTDLSSISVVGLRSRDNERLDFLITTTPPTLESGTPTIAERLFPHLANGDGYTTQFILFSGVTGQTSGGMLDFVAPDGTPLELNIN
jgi:hypothetical protein